MSIQPPAEKKLELFGVYVREARTGFTCFLASKLFRPRLMAHL